MMKGRSEHNVPTDHKFAQIPLDKVTTTVLQWQPALKLLCGILKLFLIHKLYTQKGKNRKQKKASSSFKFMLLKMWMPFFNTFYYLDV